MAGLVPAIHAFLSGKQGVDARDKRGHDDGKSSAQTSTSSFLSPCIVESCVIIAARRIPAGCRAKLSVSNPSQSQVREAERRNSRARIAAPIGRLAAKPVPPAGGNCRSITRTGAPLGAPLRRFSLDLGTAFWRRTGAADRRNALDSAGFHPPSSASTTRCRTDPCSWAGQCLPRPPEAWLTRPNPQAPHPSPFACVS